MDFEFIKQVFPLYVHAAILTLKIGILGIILAIIVGLLCTLVLHKKYTAYNTVVFYILRFAEAWAKGRCLCMWGIRTCISGRQLYV